MKAAPLIFGSGFARAYVMLSELVLLVLTTAYMPPESRGLYVVGYTLLKTAAIVAGFSLGQATLRRLAEDRSPTQVSLVAGSLSAASLGLSIAGFAALAFAAQIHEPFRLKYFLPFWPILLALPIFAGELVAYSLLVGTGRLSSANVAIVAGKSITLACAGALALRPSSLTVGSTWAAVVAGQAVIVFGYLRSARALLKELGVCLQFSKVHLLGLLKSGGKLHASVLGTILFGSLDVMFVYQNAGPADASTYQIALQLLAVLAILPHAATQFGFALTSMGEERLAWERYRRAILLVFGVYLLAALCSYPVVYYGAAIVNSGKYITLQSIYPLLLLGLPGMYLAQVMAPMWIRRGYFWRLSLLTIGTGLILIPLTYHLTHRLGIQGALIAFLGGQLLALVTNGAFLLHVNRTSHEPQPAPA